MLVITENSIGLLLRIGVMFTVLLVLLGMTCAVFTLPAAANLFWRWSILLLIELQFLRVALTLWLFGAQRAWVFVCCAVIIMLVLGYNLIQCM